MTRITFGILLVFAASACLAALVIVNLRQTDKAVQSRYPMPMSEPADALLPRVHDPVLDRNYKH